MNKGLFISTIMIVLMGCSDQQSVPGALESEKSREVHAIQFQNFTSPQGRFTVSIPVGWEFNSLDSQERVFSFSPKGQDLPDVGIGCLPGGVLEYDLQVQNPRGDGQQWSANDFLRLLILQWMKKSMPDLRIESLTSQNFQSAEAIFSGTLQGKKVQVKFACTMDYIQDRGGWWSLACMNSISAEPGEMSKVEPIAVQILQSFRPNARWTSELSEVEESNTNESWYGNENRHRPNTMEMQQMDDRQTMRSIRKGGWLDALGGTTEMKDPNTNESWKVSGHNPLQESEKSSYQQPVPRALESEKSREVHAIQFQNFTSPQGRFTVSIPVGWEFKPGTPGEEVFSFTPKGQDLPDVGISCLPHSILEDSIQVQNPRGYMQQWSANDFLRSLLSGIQKGGMPDLRIESFTSQNLQSAEAIIFGTVQGKKVQGKFVCTMDYIQDPTLVVGGWWSFAYINSISAEPGEVSKVEPIAVQIFQSFRPNARWMSEDLEAIYRGIETRMGMISGTMHRLNAMEMHQRMDEMQSMTSSGKGWIDTFGGTTNVINPNTNKSWMVNDKSKHYYEYGGEPYGTDDPTQLKGPGRTPLQRYRR